MKIKQVSVFVENEPGHLTGPVRLLAENNVDLRAVHLADSEKYGILRMIVSEPERAAQLLKDAGCTVKIVEVLAVEVADQPGGMAQVLNALDGAQLNIEYMYAYPNSCQGKAVLLFRFSDIDQAIAKLQAAGINLLDHAELLTK
jgi:hypothetical protein